MYDILNSHTPTSLETLVTMALSAPLDFEPGEHTPTGKPKTSYNNLGYSYTLRICTPMEVMYENDV